MEDIASIDLAAGAGLDAIGLRLDKRRGWAETDAHYRERLINATMRGAYFGACAGASKPGGMTMAETTVDMVISDLPNGHLRVEHRMGSRTVSYADLTPEQAVEWGQTLLRSGLSRMPRSGMAPGGASGAVVFTAGHGCSAGGRGVGGVGRP